MTCIVGLVDDDKVWIGGDSAAVSNGNISQVAHPKVFLLDVAEDRFLVGYTTSFRMGQILQYWLPKSKALHRPKEMADMEFMVTVFAEELRDHFNRFGFGTIKDNKESGGCFLIGYRGHLYRIESDYQVNENAIGYDAVGSGENFALGAMWATSSSHSAENRIKIALDAAARFSGSVVAPFTILNLGSE